LAQRAHIFNGNLKKEEGSAPSKIERLREATFVKKGGLRNKGTGARKSGFRQ